MLGKKISDYCEGMSVFYVKKETLALNRKKRQATDAQNNGPKGQYTHHSYGHYGHQSNNYAHYGHETHITGKIDKDGNLKDQTITQYQERSQGSQSFPSPRNGIQSQFTSEKNGLSSPRQYQNSQHNHNGFDRNNRNLQRGSAGQFSLQSSNEGGYQLNLPFGITGGSRYQSGVNTRGQYGVGGTHPFMQSEFKTYQPGSGVQDSTRSTAPGVLQTGLPSSYDGFKTTDRTSGAGLDGRQISPPRISTNGDQGAYQSRTIAKPTAYIQTGGQDVSSSIPSSHDLHIRTPGQLGDISGLGYRPGRMDQGTISSNLQPASHTLSVSPGSQTGYPSESTTQNGHFRHSTADTAVHPSRPRSPDLYPRTPNQFITPERLPFTPGHAIQPGISEHPTHIQSGIQDRQYTPDLLSRERKPGYVPNGYSAVDRYGQQTLTQRQPYPGGQQGTQMVHQPGSTFNGHQQDVSKTLSEPSSVHGLPQTGYSADDQLRNLRTDQQSGLQPQSTNNGYLPSGIQISQPRYDNGVSTRGQQMVPPYSDQRALPGGSRSYIPGSTQSEETGMRQGTDAQNISPRSRTGIDSDLGSQVRQQRYPDSYTSGTPSRSISGLRGGIDSSGNSASSQTQIQTGVEGTAAEAFSSGQFRGMGSQTQVQGGYAGNGSFSAQAQSGFTGGMTQSQVQGGKQGGLSGSSVTVENVGSAQSQVQIGRPSGSASSTAQGRFSRGMTQVKAQSSRSGGSAGAEAQSRGLSSSQVQVDIAGEGTKLNRNNDFQGTVSASVQGGLSSGQSQTQLQGGYDSGRTYAATAQGGFDSLSEFQDSTPLLGRNQNQRGSTLFPSPTNGIGSPSTSSLTGDTSIPTSRGVSSRPSQEANRFGGTSIPQTPGTARVSETQQSQFPYYRNGQYNPSQGTYGPSESAQYPAGIHSTHSQLPTDHSYRQNVPSQPSAIAPSSQHLPHQFQTGQPGPQTPQGPQIPISASADELSRLGSQQTKQSLNGLGTTQPSSTHFTRTPTDVSQQRIQPDLRYPPSSQFPESQPIHQQSIPPHSSYPSSQHLVPQRYPHSDSNVLHPSHLSSHDQDISRNHFTPINQQTHFQRPLSPTTLYEPLQPNHVSRQIPPTDVRQIPPTDLRQISPPKMGSSLDTDSGYIGSRPPLTGYQQPGQYRPPVQVPITTSDMSPERPRQDILHTRVSDTSSSRMVPPLPPTDEQSRVVGSPGALEPDQTGQGNCCEALKNLKRRCCDRASPSQNGACCSSSPKDFTKDFEEDGISDEDIDGEPCKVVKAICYIVYKPVGKARICKPTNKKNC